MDQALEHWNSLASSVKFLLVLVIWGAFAAGYYFLYYEDQVNNYKEIVQEFKSIRKKRDELQQIQFNIGRWKAECARLDGELDKAKTLLPKVKEIPELLTKINNLGKKSGLEISRFSPKRERIKGFYSEVPIRVSVQGTFFELMIFLNKISNLDRIVTITSINLSQPRYKNQKLLLTANFQLVTYRYLKGAPKKKG